MAAFGRPRRDLHEPLWVGDRQRFDERHVKQGEDGDIDADAQREREDGRRRESRRLAEHPQRVAQVGEDRVHAMPRCEAHADPSETANAHGSAT
jgi:hypothetical protein